jgi:hypothetical protein
VSEKWEVPAPELAVRSGIAYLDAEHPGWRERVNADTLDLGHPMRCVLGQVLGFDGWIKWRLALGAGVVRFESEHGFLPFPGYRDEWRRQLARTEP